MASIADVLIKSGLLPAHVKTPQAALAIMLKSRELGVPTMHGLSCIVVVQGKPTCNGELMLALIYRDHGDDAILFAETTVERCTISYKRRGWSERQTHTFTMEDARRAGLSSGQTWQKYPQAMLRARAISAVARMAFPDSIAGMYVYDEMGLSVTVEGGEQVVMQQGPGDLDSVEAEPEPPTNSPVAHRAVPAPMLPSSVSEERHQPSANGGTPETEGLTVHAGGENAAQWTREQLAAHIRSETADPLDEIEQWGALARDVGVPVSVRWKDMTVEWLLTLHQAMTTRSYEKWIAAAHDEQDVRTACSRALSDRDKRHLSAVHYDALCAQGEARKAELSAPLMAGMPQAVAS